MLKHLLARQGAHSWPRVRREEREINTEDRIKRADELTILTHYTVASKAPWHTGWCRESIVTPDAFAPSGGQLW